MHCQADHLDFSLKLQFPACGISIFQPLDSYYSSIWELPSINISKTAFAYHVLAAEVLCCSLELSELKPLQVFKVDVLYVLVCRTTNAISN